MTLTMRNIFTAIAVLCNTWSMAQTVRLSDDISVSGDRYYYIITDIGQTYALIKDRESSRELVLFDKKLNNYQTLNLELDRDHKTKIIEAYGHKNYMYIVYTMRSRTSTSLIVNKMDHRGHFQDSITIHQLKNDFINPRYAISRSENGRFFTIYTIEGDHELRLSSIDLNHFQTLHHDVYIFDKTRLKSELEKVLTDDSGSTFVITRNAEALNTKKRSIIDVFKIDRNQTTSFVQLPLNDINIIDVSYFTNDLGLEMIGLSNKKTNNRVEKYFQASFNQNLELTNFIEDSFSPRLLRSIYGHKTKARNGIEGLKIKSLIPLSDGGKLMISEIQRVYSRRPSFPTANPTINRGFWVDYFYEDIILIAVDLEGKQIWEKVLHKKQFSQDDNGIFSSFFIMENPSSIRLIFNDEIKQENSISEYLISPNGDYKRNSLFTTDYERVQLRFSDAVQLNKNSCLIPSESNGKMNLVKIEYD